MKRVKRLSRRVACNDDVIPARQIEKWQSNGSGGVVE